MITSIVRGDFSGYVRVWRLILIKIHHGSLGSSKSKHRYTYKEVHWKENKFYHSSISALTLKKLGIHIPTCLDMFLKFGSAKAFLAQGGYRLQISWKLQAQRLYFQRSVINVKSVTLLWKQLEKFTEIFGRMRNNEYFCNRRVYNLNSTHKIHIHKNESHMWFLFLINNI